MPSPSSSMILILDLAPMTPKLVELTTTSKNSFPSAMLSGKSWMHSQRALALEREKERLTLFATKSTPPEIRSMQPKIAEESKITVEWHTKVIEASLSVQTDSDTCYMALY